MNRVQQLYSSLSVRDAALLGATPTLMMPRFGELPEIGIGERRYVCARDGWYLQARSIALSVCLHLASSPRPLPYGNLMESVQMPHGLLPARMFDAFREQAAIACPVEWAGAVVIGPGTNTYQTVRPHIIDSSVGHIRYRVDDAYSDNLVLDIHSHGDSHAFFSDTDNASDRHGIYFSSVLGRCNNPARLQVVTRIVVDGYFHDIDWPPWETPHA